MDSICIIVPTQRRPEGLRRAVSSIFRQHSVDLSKLELLIVDNDVKPSAKVSAERLFRDAPFYARYIHEPRPGVASARNAALAASDSDLIAFLDDDEEAPSHWLSALLEQQCALGADVVFGPVQGRVPTEVERHRAYFERFFSRVGPAQSGPMNRYFGCGNSLVRRAALPDPSTPFSELRNHGGGEDDLLFSTMQACGARFAWARDGWVWEDPPPARISLSYTLRRAFGYGQAPVATCAASSPPNWLGVAGWMCQGLVQTMLFGALAGLTRLVGHASFPLNAERAARGLGKVFWHDRFKIAYYGLPPGAAPIALSALQKAQRLDTADQPAPARPRKPPGNARSRPGGGRSAQTV